MANKRKRYRVPLHSYEGVSLSILKESGTFEVGRILDISRSGAALSFQGPVELRRFPNDVLHLKLASTLLDKPIFFMGKVCSRSNLGSTSLYRVEFTDFLGLLSRLPAGLKRLLNDRNAPRFQADEKNPITVKLSIDDFNVVGFLKDLTADGMSVVIQQSLGGVRFKAKEVHASFRLPDVRCSFAFMGSVVHGHASKNGFCCGIRFDGNKSKNFQAKQDRLIHFLGDHSPAR